MIGINDVVNVGNFFIVLVDIDRNVFFLKSVKVVKEAENALSEKVVFAR